MRGQRRHIVKSVHLVSDIASRKQKPCASFPITAVWNVSDGALDTHVTVERGQVGGALRQGVELLRAREYGFFGSKLLVRMRVCRLSSYISQRFRQQTAELVAVGARDILVVLQAHTWDYVVQVGVVGVTHQARVVPDYSLRLVGAAAPYVFGRGGDTVVADRGCDVTAAEEESLDLSPSHGGAVETVVEGGVGDEGR